MTNLAFLASPAKSFFWTAAVSDSSELSTDDPLGLEYIAQQVGLLLLPTFTTRSSRAQAYAMVLYGLGLAERAISTFNLPNTDESRQLLFERWERFWALATLESLDGQLPRGDWNTMRGVRGAKAAWFRGETPLPIDFPLISRQQELGNLGAYLSPLRRANLVSRGSLSPLPWASSVVDAFWGEENARGIGKYDDYALHALDPRTKKLARTHDKLDLRKVGERSKLTSIWGRPDQQKMLYERLFETAKDDTTHPVSEIVRRATEEKIEAPRAMIEAALASRFGEPNERLRALLSTAIRFGDFMAAVMSAFDRAYMALTSAGFAMDHAPLAAATFDGDFLPDLARTGAALLEAPCASEIRALPAHGAPCLRLADELQRATGPAALDHLLAYHHKVQRERRRGTGWISAQQGKLMLLVTTYTPRAGALRFPSYKLDTVRTLLTDLGKLPTANAVLSEVVS